MKYKKLYNELKEKYEDLEYSYERRKEELEKSQGIVEGMQKSLRRIEGMESDIRVENEWLKEIISLIVVPAGKEQELAKFIEEERKKRMSPFSRDTIQKI